MEIDLLDFVERCRDLAKQALGKHAGEPANGGFARWVHVVLHCFRLEEGHSYRETPNRLKYMAEIRDALGLDRDDLPDYSTIYKSFDRLKMWVWRALLRYAVRALGWYRQFREIVLMFAITNIEPLCEPL
ncbi:hypothetical protein GCM10008995_01670 [Halobellus salinus]|uniref:ISH9-type transposase n=1 Tax=Halobellus salinus TaxID=931585 RepID=A0A830E5T5_9EURY|nr:transposase [Halobellus salinus]GGI95191.1 hypothetical protein GCM10008995_01670 [Halobellus salinus]SMP11891.1 Transposase domain [Halobellus salinus]